MEFVQQSRQREFNDGRFGIGLDNPNEFDNVLHNQNIGRYIKQYELLGSNVRLYRS